jgi:hypothetical protein
MFRDEQSVDGPWPLAILTSVNLNGLESEYLLVI